MAALPYSFKEVFPDSPEDSWEPDRSTATRTYIGPWANRISFCRYILGGPKSVMTFGPDTYISRQIPHEYPVDLLNRPVGTALYASRISKVAGVGVPSSGVTYEETAFGARLAVFEKARVTVQYEGRPFVVLQDSGLQSLSGTRTEASLKRYVTKVASPNVEIRTTMMGAYKYVASGTPTVEVGVHKTFASYNLQITWHQVPDYAIPSLVHNPYLTAPSYIDSCIGRVNSVAFNSYPIGTLLLLGVQFRPYQMAFPDRDIRCYDITYLLKYFQPVPGAPATGHGIGHQFLFTTTLAAGSFSGWYEVTRAGSSNLAALADGVSIYDWYDLNKLFTPVIV